MSETDGNHGSLQADARDAYAMQPYEVVAAPSDNQTNGTDEALHYAQNHHQHPPQDAAGPVYQSEHPLSRVHGGSAYDMAPRHELNGSAQSSESQPFYESNIADNNFANSSNEGYRANNNYGFDPSGASNISRKQQFYTDNDIKPCHDLNLYAQAYGGQSFSNTYSNSNNEVHQSNYGNGFNANDASNTTMQNHLNTEAFMQNDTNAYANRQINSSPITEAIKDAFKTNSCQSSIGSWGSEPRKKSNASDSDSDIEVWTKPSSNSPQTSSVYQASVQSNRYNSLGSTASSLTPNLLGVSNPLLGTNYNSAMMYQYRNHTPLSLPEGHVPTWDRILPPNYFTSEHYLGNNGGYGFGGYSRKKITLSLINVWEFTLEGEVSRAQIKKIAKDHVGKDGRIGALFERVGIMPDDPALKGNNNNNTLGEDSDDVYRGGGKWRIPLGAYQSLMTYLSSLGNTIVEGIPSNQLQAATLGRERFEKGYPTVDELVKRGVGKSVANALAPYQRGGVDFILDKNGRALLADEMGLGTSLNASVH
jgi:hypothetical protein